MLESSFDFLTFFSTKLFSITFTHAEHIAHTTSSEEAATLFLVRSLCWLTCLFASVHLSVSTSVNLQEKSQKHGSNENIHDLRIQVVRTILIRKFSRDKLFLTFAHFSLDHVQFGQKLLVRVKSHVHLLVLMSRDDGSIIEHFATSVFRYVYFFDFVLKKVVIQKLHVDYFLHWFFIIEQIPSCGHGKDDT